jgi:hypothetical protein
VAEVPLTLAVISTVAPVVAGALPVVVGWLRDNGRDRRDRADRRAEEMRSQCVTLLRLARDFRVLVQNTYDSRGPELIDNAQHIRQSAADIAVAADEVSFRLPAAQAAAKSLADQAGFLAATFAAGENTEYGAPLSPPAFADYDASLAEFRTAALAALGIRTAQAAAGPAQLPAAQGAGIQGAASP